MESINQISTPNNDYEKWQNLSDLDDSEISNFEEINPGEAIEILRETKIDGDDFVQMNQNTHKENHYLLSNKFLDKNGMMPMYSTEIDGLKIALSRAYKVESKDAIMAYVKTKDGYKARSYYRSSSQGIWRYLPDYTIDKETKQVDIYGKGSEYFDNATILPFELQLSLDHATRLTTTKTTEPYGKYMLVGTAKRYNSRQELRKALRARKTRGDFYQEVSPSPIQSPERLLSRQGFSPESLGTEHFLAPDFKHCLASGIFDTDLYGEVTMEEFSSKDGSLNYIFAKDAKSRVWLANIESNSKITSTGCRQEWVRAPYLMVPLYEYASSNIGKAYGDPSDRKENYVCMWQNYLSKIPMIRDYLKTSKSI